MNIRDCGPFTKKHPHIVRLLLVILYPLIPIWMTVLLWLDRWDDIKEAYNEVHDVIKDGIQED